MPTPKAPQAQSDPWEQAAAQYKASGGTGGDAAAPAEDWKIWQQNGSNSPHSPGAGSLMDTIGNVGSHLKNMVTGPLHAAFDAPDDPTEVGLAAGPGGKMALGAYRMLAKPTVQGIQTAVEQGKKGNYGLKNQPEYDASGNYTPTMLSGIADALPMVGPWARNVETEAQQKGMVPALAGLATDVLGPKMLSKIGGAGIQATGKAMKMASANAPSLKLAASRFLVPGKPGGLLQSALKPNMRYGAGVTDTMESALPHVLKADPALNGVTGFARASDAAKDAAYQPYNSIVAPYRPAPGGIGPVRPGVIDGTPIGDAQNASIPAINRFESPSPAPSAAPPPVRFSQPVPSFRGNSPVAPQPTAPRLPSMPSASEPTGIVASTAAKANIYRKPIPVATADALREDANAKLNAFYNKAGGDQNAALSSPETARVKAIGDATRQQLYPKLEADAALPKGTIEGLQRTYGELSDVSDIANKREPIFARHDPVSLSQKVVAGHGNPLSMAWNYAVQKGLGKLTNSDALVNSAVDRFQNPEATPLVPRSGILPRVTMGAGRAAVNAGKAVQRTPLRANPLFYGTVNQSSSRGRE